MKYIEWTSLLSAFVMLGLNEAYNWPLWPAAVYCGICVTAYRIQAERDKRSRRAWRKPVRYVPARRNAERSGSCRTITLARSAEQTLIPESDASAQKKARLCGNTERTKGIEPPELFPYSITRKNGPVKPADRIK